MQWRLPSVALAAGLGVLLVPASRAQSASSVVSGANVTTIVATNTVTVSPTIPQSFGVTPDTNNTGEGSVIQPTTGVAGDPGVLAPRQISTQIGDSNWTVTPRALQPSQSDAHLANMSVRAYLVADATLTAGGSIVGTGSMGALVRAIGPGLTQFGIKNALPQAPHVTVYRGAQFAAETNGITPELVSFGQSVGAFPAQPSTNGMNVGDAALFGLVSAGTFTVQCASDGNPGDALVEIYEAGRADSTTTAHVANFSARTDLGFANDVLVVGFVVVGDGKITILARGAGLSLASLGVTNGLPDPAIELYAGETVVASNDDWNPGDAALLDATARCGAYPLTSARDAAVLAVLGAGTYTLHVRAAGPKNGVQAVPAGAAIGEIYVIDSP